MTLPGNAAVNDPAGDADTFEWSDEVDAPRVQTHTADSVHLANPQWRGGCRLLASRLATGGIDIRF